jgi:hypothetical protein
MKFNEVDNNIELDRQESNIIDLAVTELGGPLHSPFAKHLQNNHFSELDRIRNKVNKDNQAVLEDIHLVIDVLQVLMNESLDTDWGTLYDGVQKEDLQKVLENLIQIYSERLKKY